jgi:hypothetical protein
MTVHITNVQRARAYAEGSFATDGSGASIGSFLDLPFVEGTMNIELNEPMETPGIVQQYQDAQPLKVHMPKRAKASFEINLAGLGLASGGPRTRSPLGALLYVALGVEDLGTGSTITTGASATSLPLSSAAGLEKGNAIAAATGPGGRLEMREIKNIATNTATLKHALSSSPANSSTIYAAATYVPYTAVNSAARSLQLLVEGLEPDDRFLLLGGQVESVTFSVANGMIARMSFTWKFANWFYADGVNTAGDFVGPTLAAATYANTVPVVVKDSELTMYTAGTSTYTSPLDAMEYEITLNLSYIEHLAPGGTNNIVRYVRARTVPLVAGSFTIPYESETWRTSKASKTVHSFSLQIGSSPTTTTGGGVLITAPAVQVVDVQQVDAGGIRAQRVSWEGTIDSDITSPTANDDLHNAAFRVHLF